MQGFKKPAVVFLLCVLFVFFTAPEVGLAFTEPMMIVDGRELALPLTPVWAEECLLIPLRPVLEAMGAVNLNWDPEECRITWQWEAQEYMVQIDNTGVVCAGKEVELVQAPLIVQGHTLVPAGFIEEIFQVDAKWNAHARYFEVVSRGGREREREAKRLEKQQQVVDTALKYQGVPYRWGGTGPGGFDCSGFVWYVFRENGIQLPRVSFEMYEIGAAVGREELLPGDLVFFEGYRAGPSHGTIYIGDGKFIHSPSEGYCVSICRMDDPEYWAPRYYGARRVIE